MHVIRFALVGFSAAAIVGAAHGQVQFSFNYNKLDGRYNTGTSLFTADAAVGPTQIASLGDVTRNVAPNSQAIFNEGFVGLPDQGAFHLELNVSNVLGPVASGFGTFTITDADNDTITGTISGDRTQGLGFTQFSNNVNFFGVLANVMFTGRNGAGVANGDTTFDGSNGGSFSFADLVPIFTGSLVELFMSTGGSSFTSNDFGYVSGDPNRPPVPVGLNAQLVPTPGAITMLGLGGVALLGRRRR